jgi:hypothetical protein
MGQPHAEEGSSSPIDSNHDGRGARVTLICSLLCSVLIAGVFDVREAPATCGWRIVVLPIFPQDFPSCYDSAMSNLVILFIHFLATLARLLGPWRRP